MTTRLERLALSALLVIVVGLPTAVLAYYFGLYPRPAQQARTINIVAAAPEAGGFQPDMLRIAAGEPVRLRFSVPDVTHGIAIGPGVGIDLGPVEPGHVKEVETTFDRPGRYTVYCNTWCSPYHWRMRGTIEVYDPAHPEQLPPAGQADAVITRLIEQGVDIDAPHPAPLAPPTERPSAVRGAAIAGEIALPTEMNDPAWRRANSPAQAYAVLHGVAPALGVQQAWDAVAFAWLHDMTSESRTWAADQYARNCAACHSETGDGQGLGGEALHSLRSQGIGGHDHGQAGRPAAFADPETMLGGSSNIYYAKIRRGGMGTGMPDFGPIFTEDEVWALVNYLWTFQFDKAPLGK